MIPLANTNTDNNHTYASKSGTAAKLSNASAILYTQHAAYKNKHQNKKNLLLSITRKNSYAHKNHKS